MLPTAPLPPGNLGAFYFVSPLLPGVSSLSPTGLFFLLGWTRGGCLPDALLALAVRNHVQEFLGFFYSLISPRLPLWSFGAAISLKLRPLLRSWLRNEPSFIYGQLSRGKFLFFPPPGCPFSHCFPASHRCEVPLRLLFFFFFVSFFFLRTTAFFPVLLADLTSGA